MMLGNMDIMVTTEANDQDQVGGRQVKETREVFVHKYLGLFI
jgi:hypothetical protein